MSGETCPRCRNNNGYPVRSTIPRGGQKMVFVCRDCGHHWRKRNMPKGIPLKWFVYGIGFVVGGIYGLYELLINSGIIKGLMESVKGLFANIFN